MIRAAQTPAAATSIRPSSPRVAAIRIDGLTKFYGSTLGVADISLVVPRGEIFGIVGPNGAGKTTLIGCLLGLLEPDAGTVDVLGLTPGADRRALFARVGVKLQEDDGVYSRMRLQEALRLFASFYRDPLTPEHLLAEFGLKEKAQSFFRDLSGGQRVRALVALALIGQPELLVLDEPTTGLDPQARFNLWETLEAARERGTTIVASTHYLEEAEEHFDRIAFISEGFTVACGSPADLLRERRLEVRIAMPDALASLEELERLPNAVYAEKVRNRALVYGGGDGLIESVLALAERNGVGPAAVETRPARLADFYVLETGREYRTEG